MEKINPLLTKIDIKILDALQKNGRITNQELADKVGLSVSPCWRRVKQLEQENVISGYHAHFHRRSLGLGVMAFVRIKIGNHSESEAKKFDQAVLDIDEVIACYRIGGDADFLLQVVTTNLDDYADLIVPAIGRLPGIKEMQTMFVLKEVKQPTHLPIKLV